MCLRRLLLRLEDDTCLEKWLPLYSELRILFRQTFNEDRKTLPESLYVSRRGSWKIVRMVHCAVSIPRRNFELEVEDSCFASVTSNLPTLDVFVEDELVADRETI